MLEHNKVVTMTSFAELTKQVHLINDLILADMTCAEDSENTKEAVTFSKHLLATKYWFARVSYANKKKYLLALLHDVRSAWALSLLLKSMWNCRPKDAVLSVSEFNIPYTSYDQVPMDHNRTALPAHTLAQVMKSDRIWFYSLDPESQALVLSELSTVAGGPAMWEMLRLAQRVFERNRDLMLKNIQECTVVNDHKHEKPGDGVHAEEVRPPGEPKRATLTPPPPQAQTQKMLDASLVVWNGTIKSMRDSLKLEELELTFNDGTKRKIWKVNRPKPENIETVDFIQLLPSSIGKKILLYLPRSQLVDYAKVNKYWAYLVDELKAELAARIKIDADYDKLNDLLFRFDTSLEMFISHGGVNLSSSQGYTSTVATAHKPRPTQPSLRPSEKSAGAYSHRQFISEKLTKPMVIQKPIRNVRDLSERLQRRGAADENIWKWCDCILAHAKKHKQIIQKSEDGDDGGILTLGKVHFPCPLMKNSVSIPLNPPLYKDPIMTTSAKPRRNVSECNLDQAPKETVKRYKLWTRDVSSLYHVIKIPSYMSPEKTDRVTKRFTPENPTLISKK